jgi:hypothetical protein
VHKDIVGDVPLRRVQSYWQHVMLAVSNIMTLLSLIGHAGWLDFLVSFGPRVEYIPGLYIMADVLSRHPPSSLVSPPYGRADGKPEVLRDGPSTAAPPLEVKPLWNEVGYR